MPTIRRRTTGEDSAGAAVTAFPLQGSQYEYLPFDARVEFALVGVSQGTTPDPAEVDQVTATVFSGSDILQQRGPISNKTNVTAGSQSAVYPDDFLLDDVAAAGERLSVQLEIPPSAAATTQTVVDTVVKITPI